jgi:hypothetical protein
VAGSVVWPARWCFTLSILLDLGIPTIIVDYTSSSSRVFFRIRIVNEIERNSIVLISRDYTKKSIYRSIRVPGLSEFRIDNIEYKLSRR